MKLERSELAVPSMIPLTDPLTRLIVGILGLHFQQIDRAFIFILLYKPRHTPLTITLTAYPSKQCRPKDHFTTQCTYHLSRFQSQLLLMMLMEGPRFAQDILSATAANTLYPIEITALQELGEHRNLESASDVLKCLKLNWLRFVFATPSARDVNDASKRKRRDETLALLNSCSTPNRNYLLENVEARLVQF